MESLKVIDHEKIGKILFETSPDMLAVLDSAGKILDCNKQLEKYTCYEKNELIGLVGPVDLVFDDDVESALSAFEELKNTDLKLNVPLRMKRKDGSVFFSLWSGATLRDKFNNLEGYLVTGKDISDVKELENKLTCAEKHHHQEKLALIGQLTSRLAHDIRNPLSIISATLENFKSVRDGDQMSPTQFDKVQRSIFRISNQIDDVLDFVRKQPLMLKKNKCSDIISYALDSVFVPDDVVLKLPKNDVELNCDRERFSTVISNLVLNGIQAVDGKGLVEIRLKEEIDGVIIEVEDSGTGIMQDHENKIFEPLFTTKQTGTGLGLASAKSIVESHNGAISVKSPPTIFTISLPVKLET